MMDTLLKQWRGAGRRVGTVSVVLLALAIGSLAVWASDSDNDGVSDEYAEFFGLGGLTNIAGEDYDADELTTFQESLLWTDPLMADTDHDGFSDGMDSNPVSRAWVPWGEPLFTRTNEMVYTWPPWMISAFKAGGEWDTNTPAWHVASWDTNSAVLNMEVDRGLLTNNLRMRMGYVDQSNATLYLDLYDTNEVTIASNLLQNLLAGGGSLTTRTFAIPMAAYTNAVGIRLRRDSGEVTIRDSLLYVDEDGDGLDAWQEIQLGTSDGELDSDHDGFSDYEEAFTYGTDPASALSVPYGTIIGNISYSGVQTGLIRVLAAANSGSWTSQWTASRSEPGSYSLTAPARQSYSIKAYRDVNGNSVRDYWEPCGMTATQSLYLDVAGQSGINVVIADPDTDGDGMSDVAELMLGLDPFTSSTFSSTSFVELFETNTVHMGDIHGQNGWHVSATNEAMIQTNVVFAGSQALAIKVADDSSSTARQYFVKSAATSQWLDVEVQVKGTVAPADTVDSAVSFFFNDNGQLVVLDGHQTGTNRWVTLTNATALSEGDWARVSVKADFAGQVWLICLNGLLVADGLGFGIPAAELHCFETLGQQGRLDNLRISAIEPAGISADGDTMTDDWEMQYFGNLDQVDGGDADQDGISNHDEYLLGLNPTNADTDADGYTDYQEVNVYHTSPTNAASFPTASITGAVADSGVQTAGVVRVLATVNLNDWTSPWSVTLTGTGSFVITNVPLLHSYWVRAWRDMNNDGVRDYWEPCGFAAGAPVTLNGNLSNVTVNLVIPSIDPTVDMDGDGMSDVAELMLGLDPFTSNTFTSTPFIELFETDTVMVGDIHGQNGWHVSATNEAMIQTNVVFAGSQALAIKVAADIPMILRQYYAKSASTSQWVDAEVLAQAAEVPTGEVDSAVSYYFNDNGQLVVLDGTNQWLTLTNHVAVMTGGWTRVTTRIDYGSQTWLICLNGVKVAEGLGFAMPMMELHCFEAQGQIGRLDNFTISDTRPYGLSMDGNSMPDEWEMANFGALNQDDNADPDGDGLSNLGEFRNGTDPHNPDTDGDGFSDGYEVAHGLNPLLAGDATLDPDNDGLSNLQEAINGADPHNPDTDGDGLTDGDEVNIYHTNPLNPDTDGDGMPDGWDVAHGLNPLVNDAALDPDNDGLTNFQEYQHGTDPYNPDTDGDGLTDGYEMNWFDTNLLNVDTDGDGIPDGWEVTHGLNPLDPFDAVQDADHDRLTNLQEFGLGTDPNTSDTDHDGLPDTLELSGTLSDPTNLDILTFTNVVILNGVVATNRVGGWMDNGTSVALSHGRGSVDFGVNLSSGGVLFLEVAGGAYYYQRGVNSFPLRICADGIYVANATLTSLNGDEGKIQVLMPYLPEGAHTITLYWENLRDYTGLSINRLALKALPGVDADSDGMPDWCNRWLVAENGVDSLPSTTAVSPYCLEGKARYEKMVSVGGATVKGTGNQRWYRNVSLSVTGLTTMAVSLENGGLLVQRQITWAPLNLFAAPDRLTLRAGDTLRLAVGIEGDPAGMTQIVVNGFTNEVLAVGVPVDVAFPTSGVFHVTGTLTLDGGMPESRTVTVEVMDGRFGSSPVAWPGRTRTWVCPDLPTNAVVVADSHLNMTDITPTGSVGRTFQLGIDMPVSRYVSARVGVGGAILDAAEVLGVSVNSSLETSINLVETYPDGTLLIEYPVIVSDFRPGMTVELIIFTAGVTFEDGSLTKTLTASDFDVYGVCNVRFLYPSGLSTSFCHRLDVLQDGVLVGRR